METARQTRAQAETAAPRRRPEPSLDFCGVTDTGRIRSRNEDNFYLSFEDRICVVADGMGGHRRGDLASYLAVTELAACTRSDADPEPCPDLARRLTDAIHSANELIFMASQGDGGERKGMGTTVVAGAFVEDGCYLAHVGDSRAYRLRGHVLEQLTEDHSFANDCVAAGLITKADIPHFRYRNVITRALGRKPRVEVELAFVPHRPGDIFLFCSDGLTDMLGDETLRHILLKHGEHIDRACMDLVEEANRAGGRDNVTAVLVRIGGA